MLKKTTPNTARRGERDVQPMTAPTLDQKTIHRYSKGSAQTWSKGRPSKAALNN